MENTLSYTKTSDNRYVVLGVAFDWGCRKGLDVFVELSHRLPKELYRIVLVGTDDNIDDLLPKDILSIHRTQNQHQLAELYTLADVFLIPTREDNYPTVNLESLACGTPVVTFRTGGSPEMLDDKTGIVVEVNDIEATEKAIKDICEKKSATMRNISLHIQKNSIWEKSLQNISNCTQMF